MRNLLDLEERNEKIFSTSQKATKARGEAAHWVTAVLWHLNDDRLPVLADLSSSIRPALGDDGSDVGLLNSLDD
jgi:hypothetical protein